MAGTMEDQLLQLLADTQLPAEGPRKQAEEHLQHAQSNPAFPGSLAAIATHSSVSGEIRQAALLLLRTFVEKNWSGENEDGVVVPISDQTKEQLRIQMLELATSGDADRKIKSAARYVSNRLKALTLANGWLVVTL
jgi:importin-9